MYRARAPVSELIAYVLERNYILSVLCLVAKLVLLVGESAFSIRTEFLAGRLLRFIGKLIRLLRFEDEFVRRSCRSRRLIRVHDRRR